MTRNSGEAALVPEEASAGEDAPLASHNATPEGQNATGGKTVGAVVSAVKILRFLSRTTYPVGVSRIAKETKVNTSTCFNILRTLAADDLVQFDPYTKTYSLGLGIIEIARGASALRGNLSVLRPHMERIAQDRGVTVTLWQRMSPERKVLTMSALSMSAMRIQMTVGQRLPIYHGGGGRVFAAFSPDEDEATTRRRFDEITWNRPITFEEFIRQVQETRERGWAIDEGYFDAGIVSIAAPVLDRNGHAIAAVSATMFASQFQQDDADALAEDLRSFARDAARILGEPEDA